MPRSVAAALASAALLTVAPVSAEAAPEKPNVVIFVSDDEGYGELGCQGNPEIPTPHIDSIAANGVRFTNGYVSGPYCSPTRAGLMTGRYQTRFGHEWNPPRAPEAGLPVSEATIADRMKKLGYATAAVGKWHLGSAPKFRPTSRGFDEFYGTLANTSFFQPKQWMDTRASDEVREVLQDPELYTTDAYAARAVDWIERHKDEPFFLYLPFNAQHAPLQAPPKYLDRFPGIADEKRKTFAAMMAAKDDAVGAVLAKVREIGEEGNTLVVYFADNGGPTEQTTSKNDPLRGFKATTLEGGIRVPFLMQWKGRIPAGKTYDHPVIQLDLLPTAVAAAGGEADPAWKLDGVNLLPYLTGEKEGKPHETLYWRFGQQKAIRHGDWKLVANRIDGPRGAPEWKLYDLAADIGEANDLSAENPGKAKELAGLWDAWNAEQADPRWQAPENRRPRPNAAGGRRPNAVPERPAESAR